jgi:predicted nucleotidyltransferase
LGGVGVKEQLSIATINFDVARVSGLEMHGHDKSKLAPEFGDAARFILGGENVFKHIVMDKLKSVRSVYEQTSAMLEVPLDGMTIFGSSVKGRMHEGSDIDVAIFVSPEALKARLMPPHRTLSGFIRTQFEQSSPDASPSIFVMSNELIDEWARNTRSTDTDLVKEGSFSSGIVPLFYMMVGEGKVAEYRNRLLDQLEARGGSGEIIFAKLMEAVAHFEELNRRSNIRLPTDIQSAREYFIVKPESVEAPPQRRDKIGAAISRVFGRIRPSL